MQPAVESEGELSRTRRARRSQLMAVAASIFLQSGYGATTMERVAAKGGVSKATLYKYFPDKDQLFLVLIRERQLAPDQGLLLELRRTIQHMVTQLQDPPVQDELAHTLLRLLKASTRRRNDAYFRLLVEVAFANPTLVQAVRRELMAGEAVDSMPLPAGTPGTDLPDVMQIVFLAMHGHMLLSNVGFNQERIDEDRLAAALASMLTATLARP